MPATSTTTRNTAAAAAAGGVSTATAASSVRNGVAGSSRPLPAAYDEERCGAVRKHTYMARLILKMDECLSLLGVDTQSDAVIAKMESMAILIHESMSISSRNYHSVQHVFDISKDLKDPIEILAALFHDCVYYHVDGGLSKRQAEILEGITAAPNSVCYLKKGYEEPLLTMVAYIFDFSEGQELKPLMGVNEFLSAVIAVRELNDLLPKHMLASIACCIEATIPFRPTTPETGTPMDRLHAHMQNANEKCGLQMSEEDIVRSVQRAVRVTNEDVANFGQDDQGWFLDNTWNLLPESNAALRHQYLYTVKDFQFAVFKMYGFFSFLKPTVVFQQFHGVPTDEEYTRRTNGAARNIAVGRKYIGAKLLSISVVAAFAELTGGDAPISLFMGDLPSRNRVSRRLEDSLPHYREDELKGCDFDVYRLLSQGRKSETAFDIKQSPLAAYLYAYLSDDGVEEIMQDVKTYPMDEEIALTLLKRLPRSAIEIVAHNLARIAQSRSELIRRVVRKLPPDHLFI